MKKAMKTLSKKPANTSEKPSERFVILAAGGTGGHVFPAEALAVDLESRGCRVALVTDNRGKALPGHLGKIETHRIRAGGIAGLSWSNRATGVIDLAVGTMQAGNLLSRLKPNLVVGFGGYASAPTMAAAELTGLRTVIHEQNAVLGRANRLLAWRATRIATSFRDTDEVPAGCLDKVVVTGMPVRPEAVAFRDTPYPEFTEDGPINLLVFGGSQGANVFARVIPEALYLLPDQFRRRIRIVQQCRPEDLQRVRIEFERVGVPAELNTFFDDMPKRVADAHLVICRSGASTVAEVTTIGRPSIMVPYPHAVDEHQAANAEAVAIASGGWVIPETQFSSDVLADRMKLMFSAPQSLLSAAKAAHAAGRPEAAKALADMVFAMLEDNGGKAEKRAAA